MDSAYKLNWWLYDKLLTVAAYVLIFIAIFLNHDLFTSILFVAIVVIMLFCSAIFRACSYKYQPYKYKVKVRKAHPLWNALQTLFLFGALSGTTLTAVLFNTSNGDVIMVFTIVMCVLSQLCAWRNDRWRTMSKETVGKKF